VALAWDPNPESNIVGYSVYYGTNSLAYTKVIQAGKVTTQTVSNLSPGLTYYFAVTAYNSLGLESVPSNEISYRVPATNPPAFLQIATALASGISALSATLNGTLSFDGQVTAVYFQYGTDTKYGRYTATNYYSALTPALLFNGSNSFVSVPGFGTNAPTGEITLEFWQLAKAVKPQFTFILNPDDQANRLSAHTPWGDGWIYWDFGNINTGGRAQYVTNSAVGTWQHFALVASQSGNYMRIYQNGILAAEKPGMTPLTRSNRELRIGGTATAFGNNMFFDGFLNEFRIWNTALDQATIKSWMSSRLTSQHPAYARLQAYWPMNEGSGTTVTDQSGHNQTGFLVNRPTWVVGEGPHDGIRVPLSGLIPATTYYYRMVASNSAGVAFGAEETFTTPSGTPAVTTLMVGSIWTNLDGTLNANLAATVNPNGLATTVYFQYGLTTNYTSTTPSTSLSGTNLILASQTISGLLPGWPYHYRVVASNSQATSYGSDEMILKPSVKATTIRLQSGGTLLLEFSGAAGAAYEVQTSTNLQSWTTMTNVLADANGLLRFNERNMATDPKRFYRLKSALPLR
jgi:Concanavalin A-like lectin/glucanases superfamily/Fibronectin type III domain